MRYSVLVPLILSPCIRMEAESQHPHLAGTCFILALRQMKLLTIHLNSFNVDCNMPDCIIFVTPDAPKHLYTSQF